MEARRSQLDHDTAMTLAATEYDRCVAQFRRLMPADWSRRTSCPAWDVRQVVAHMLGMVEMAATLRELVRQQRLADRAGGGIDALTELQVAERADWPAERIVDRYELRAPRAVAGRRRLPGFLRGLTLPGLEPVNGVGEPWTVGYLFDVILTRDPWLHRIELCRSIDQSVTLTADHDGVLVADVVAEWSDRHGKDFDLTLTGPAGGHWSIGDNGPVISLDAIDFCWILSGRTGTVGLDVVMSTEVPF